MKTEFLAKISPQALEAARWIALVLLPAVTTLWLALGPIWGLPRVQEIGATLTAIDAFLGTILGVTAQSLAKAKAEATAEATRALAGQIEAFQAQLNELKADDTSKAAGGDADAR